MGRRRRKETHAMDGNKPMILNAIPNTCEADQGRLSGGSEVGETDLERSERAPELLLVAKSSEQVLVCLLDLSLLGRGRRERVQIGFVGHGRLDGAGGCLWVWSRVSVLAQGEQKGSRRGRRGRVRTNRVLKGQAYRGAERALILLAPVAPTDLSAAMTIRMRCIQIDQ